MIVNKKFDRLRQWGKEKMGAEVKTGTSDDFKALETEMNLRQEGLDKIHASMSTYVKSLNKRAVDDGKGTHSIIGSLSSSMGRHAEDFEESSTFSQCLSKFGSANERVARAQDAYAAQASSTWLESLDRSLAQMREYQNARKKLDSRRLAYDASLARMQKAKRDDYRAEEDLRCQKAKFEESNEDVQRRMQDIIDSEQDNITELTSFLEAELDYHERCRDILLRLKEEWPAGPTASMTPPTGRGPRFREGAFSRSSTNSSLAMLASKEDPDGPALRRPSAPFHDNHRARSANSSPQRETIPALSRCVNGEVSSTRSQIALSTSSAHDDGDSSSSPEHHSFWESSSTTRSSSPATTASYPRSRNGSLSTADTLRAASCGNTSIYAEPVTSETVRCSTPLAKKPPPPPPPPSRGTKGRAPPPPPPMKRSALSTSAVPHAM